MASPAVNRRAVLSMILAGGGAAALAACGPPNAGSPPATGGPITLTDQRGKTLTFDKPVIRVVTIPMPSASLLVAVDQGADHLAAMHNASWVAMRDGTMGQMFPAVLEIPHDIATDDFTPNVESIRALNPDVVVQWSDSRLTEPLENAGLKVIGLTNTGQQQDVDAWAALFATMLGKPDRAVQMKARSDGKLKAIQALAATRAAGSSILYINRFTGGLKVAGTGSYNDFYIKLVGGSNPATGPHGVAGKGMVGVDVEQVLSWDPEVILLGNFDNALPKDVYSDPVLASTSAARNKRVYKVPLGGYRWDPPGQESPLMWQWLLDISFPVPSSSLRATIPEYYGFLYGRTPTPAEIDTMLWLDANGGSANYQQFHGA
ncbi:ABC transporter substrate-binding protein [Pseudarthrobacter sp. P1]|uniref:ABC transporter substrate-binding protein n=1 Tax=Pseudarthrobacter sp. P1 TaxID=3418418 RepID=UPI003CFB8674